MKTVIAGFAGVLIGVLLAMTWSAHAGSKPLPVKAEQIETAFYLSAHEATALCATSNHDCQLYAAGVSDGYMADEAINRQFYSYCHNPTNLELAATAYSALTDANKNNKAHQFNQNSPAAYVIVSALHDTYGWKPVCRSQ